MFLNLRRTRMSAEHWHSPELLVTIHVYCDVSNNRISLMISEWRSLSETTVIWLNLDDVMTSSPHIHLTSSILTSLTRTFRQQLDPCSTCWFSNVSMNCGGSCFIMICSFSSAVSLVVTTSFRFCIVAFSSSSFSSRAVSYTHLTLPTIYSV